MTITFEEKVRALSAKEVILLMVGAIEYPVIKLDLETFGAVYGDVCYGCAATNMLGKLGGVVFDKTNIDEHFHAEAVNAGVGFVSHFEGAIDFLRSGSVYSYNLYAEGLGMAKITDEGFGEKLPYLHNDFTVAELDVYKRLADFQEQSK